jgi:hypothetical protein
MRILIKVLYNTVFTLVLLIGYLFKGFARVMSILGLRLQDISFAILKVFFKWRQNYKVKRADDRNTKMHLKELADLLEAELMNYQQDIDSQRFYNLRGMIARSLRKRDLNSLTALYETLFELPSNQVLKELHKLSIKNSWFLITMER